MAIRSFSIADTRSIPVDEPAHAGPSARPSRPAHTTADAGTMTLSGLIDLIRRYLLHIVAATAATTMLALAYLVFATPVYTSTAAIFIDPRTRQVVREETVDGGYGTDLALVESQIAIATSDGVLGRVVDKLKLTEDSDFAPTGSGMMNTVRGLFGVERPTPDPQALAITNLARAIKVKRAQRSFVIEIEASATSPVMAARIASAVVDAYFDDQLKAKSTEAARINALIDGRLDELRNQVKQAEQRVDDYKKKNKIVSSDGGIVSEQQLSRLNGELATARAVAAEARARQDQISAVLKSGGGAEMLPEAIRSPLIQRLREQHSQLSGRAAALEAQLQPRHPVMVDARSQVAEVKAQINAELKRIATASKSEYNVAKAREDELSRRIDAAKADVSASNTALIRVRALEQEAAADRKVLETYLERAKETRQQEVVTTPDARVISPPIVPAKPSRPIPLLALGLGLISGLGIGLAWALISDQFDETVRSIDELESAAGLPMIGAIPELKSASFFGRGSPRKASHAVPAAQSQYADLLMAIANPKHESDRPFRQSVLRILRRIKSAQKPGRPHTVMVASARPDAGNSATTLSLAYAAALAGERVLLVDATSTDSALSDVFAPPIDISSAVVLDSKPHLNRIIARDSTSGLAMLPIALTDLRLLKMQQRRRLVAGLNALTQDYDLVFIDSGSVLEDEAAMTLLPTADQIVIVGRSGKSSVEDIDAMLDVFDQAKDKVSGGILTFAADVRG